MVRLDDDFTSSGSVARALNSRKEGIPAGASQFTSMPDLVAALAEVSAVPKNETSPTGGAKGITRSTAMAPSARGRHNAPKRTRHVVLESKKRKAAPQREAQLEARQNCRLKSETGEQTDEAYMRSW